MSSQPLADAALPIDEVLPQIREALRGSERLVIAAPPGAGKTTRVPLVLLDEPWTQSRKLILLEPRRIAARAAAERMAQTLGEPVGKTIGLRSRLDVRVSPASRIEVVTEGVFARMILDDPGLEGVAGVLFDEFHERSLDADEGLALALDAQSVLRPDLRIVLMSATLDVKRVAAFLDAPVVASEGKSWPVETIYLGSDPHRRLEAQMADAIRRAIGEQDGSVLAFLPGVAEIRRTADLLDRLPPHVRVAPLYGALTPAEQTAAIAPPPPGERKVVLATDLAESALTIQDVRIVVDSGLSRLPRFDPALGFTRLETVRSALSSADQRRGRAGRLGPGVCYRLWREAEQRGFAAQREPEIWNADLSGLALDLSRWGARDPASLRWLDAPPDAAWRAASIQLARSGALDADGAITARGRLAAAMALPPRLALMVLAAHDIGLSGLAAEIAAVMSERDLGGRSTDLADRLQRFRTEHSPRANAMRDLARRWARQAGGARIGEDDPHRCGEALALAFSERIALARAAGDGRYLMAGGRGCRLDETDPLAREAWLAIADLTGAGADLRITLAARLSADDALRLGGVATSDQTQFDADRLTVRARRVRRLGAIVVEDRPLPSPPAELVAQGLLEAVREHGLAILPHRAALDMLAARVNFLAGAVGSPWPSDFKVQLETRLDDWLAPILPGLASLHDLGAHALEAAALTLLDWPLPQDLDRLAPKVWNTPVGRSVMIDYLAEGGPLAACKVQEAFGPAPHPKIAGGRTALAVSLLSPAQRTVALTRDLPEFWRNGYKDLRKDMRGRYPKHDWPDSPEAAAPSSRAKPRD